MHVSVQHEKAFLNNTYLCLSPFNQARKEVLSRVPVTPPESAEWMGLMMAELWAPFMAPMMIKENLGAWQVHGWIDLHCFHINFSLSLSLSLSWGSAHNRRYMKSQEKVSSTAPPGWSIELADLSFGTDAPRMTNYRVRQMQRALGPVSFVRLKSKASIIHPPTPLPQAYNDVARGKLSALECDMELISGTMRVTVRGTGPLGQFTATVSNFSVKGAIRMLPVPSEKVILWSFKEAPDANFKIQVMLLDWEMGSHHVMQMLMDYLSDRVDSFTNGLSHGELLYYENKLYEVQYEYTMCRSAAFPLWGSKTSQPSYPSSRHPSKRPSRTAWWVNCSRHMLWISPLIHLPSGSG